MKSCNWRVLFSESDALIQKIKGQIHACAHVPNSDTTHLAMAAVRSGNRARPWAYLPEGIVDAVVDHLDLFSTIRLTTHQRVHLVGEGHYGEHLPSLW